MKQPSDSGIVSNYSYKGAGRRREPVPRQLNWKEELEKAFSRFSEGIFKDDQRVVKFHKKGINYDLHSLLSEGNELLQKIPDLQSWGRKNGNLESVAEQWAGRSTKLWSSRTLHLDLGLMLRDAHPEGIETCMLIASQKMSPGIFLFIICKGSYETQSEIFADDMVCCLRKSLAQYISGKLPYILPLTFPERSFSADGIKTAVEQSWNNNPGQNNGFSAKPQNMRQLWDNGPTSLSREQFEQFEKAIFLMHSLSWVPCNSMNEGPANSRYLMEPAMTDAVLCILAAASEAHAEIQCSLKETNNVCAVLEAARRLSACWHTSIYTSTSFKSHPDINDAVSHFKKIAKEERAPLNISVKEESLANTIRLDGSCRGRQLFCITFSSTAQFAPDWWEMKQTT